MSCVKFLRTELKSDADVGGLWTYDGYSASSSTGPFNDNPAFPLVGVSSGQQYGTTDNPSIDTTGVSNGFYKFNYQILDGCTTNSDLIVEIKEAQCPGGDFSTSLCQDDPLISLGSLWDSNSPCSPTIYGTITNPNSPTGANGSNIGGANSFDFDPSNNDIGTHTIINTVDTVSGEPGFTVECNDCSNSATALVTIYPADSAGEEFYVPYLSICEDPACTVNLYTTLQNLPNTTASLGGNWYFQGISDGTNWTNNDCVDLGINNVTQEICGSADGIVNGDLISAADVSVLVNFTQATTGDIHRFRYIVNEGTPCARTTEVDIYLGPIPEAGNFPNKNIGCMYPGFANNYPARTEANASGSYNLDEAQILLWNELGGSPSPQGSWTLNGFYQQAGNYFQTSSFFSGPNGIAAAHNENNTNPAFLFSGADDILDLKAFTQNAYIYTPSAITQGGAELLDGWVPGGRVIRITGNYTAELPSTYLCGSCNPDTESFNIDFIVNYDTGTSPYSFSGNAYVLDEGISSTIDLATLITGGEDGGFWKVTNQSPAVQNLIVGARAPATKNTNAELINVTGPAAMTLSTVLDFTNVPYGTYGFTYFAVDSGVPCYSQTRVWIEWTSGCAEVVNITNVTTDFCTNDPVEALTATIGGGTWSGNGVTGSNFNPSAAGPGTHTITYTYVDGDCTYVDTIDFTVTTIPTLTLITTFCDSPTTYEVQFNVSGNSPLVVASIGTVSQINLFTYKVEGIPLANSSTITATANGCQDQLVVSLNTITPTIDNVDLNFCESDPSATLIGTPTGGTWSGSGVSGNTFFPSIGTIGKNTVTYTVTSNGCTFETTKDFEIHADPDLTATLLTCDGVDFYNVFVETTNGGIVTATAGTVNQLIDNSYSVDGVPIGQSVTITQNTGDDPGDCEASIIVNPPSCGCNINASVDVTSENCIWNLNLHVPGNTIFNEYGITIADNSLIVKQNLEWTLTDSCNGVIDTGSVSRDAINTATPYSFSKRLSVGSLAVGDEFVEIKINEYPGESLITIPLAGTTAVLNGVGGTTTVPNLAYNPASPTVFEGAIAIAIENYLGVLGYTNGVNYDMYTESVLFGSNRTLYIHFAYRHNPASTYCSFGPGDSGPDVYGSLIRGAGPTINIGSLNTPGGLAQDMTVTIPPGTYPDQPGQLQVTGDITGGIGVINSATSTPTNIVLLSATKPFSEVLGSNNLISQTDYTLTANSTGCSGTPTYSWSSGETTQVIEKNSNDHSGQTFTVTITCPDGATCTNQDSFMIP